MQIWDIENTYIRPKPFNIQKAEKYFLTCPTFDIESELMTGVIERKYSMALVARVACSAFRHSRNRHFDILDEPNLGALESEYSMLPCPLHKIMR